MHVYVRVIKLVLSFRVTTCDLGQVTSPTMEVKRYYIVSYIIYMINPTALATHTSLSPIRNGFAHGFVNYKKGALDSQPI